MRDFQSGCNSFADVSVTRALWKPVRFAEANGTLARTKCCLVDEIPQVTNNSPPTNPNTRQVNKPSPQTATTPRKMMPFAEAKRKSRQASCQTQHMIVICAFRRGEMRVVVFSCVSSRRKRLFARGGARKKGPQGQLLSKFLTPICPGCSLLPRA